MARAANASSVTITASNVLTGDCRRLWVRCDSGSAASVNVRVRNRDRDSASGSIHSSSDYITLAAGEEQIFDASADNPIDGLYLFTDSGTGTASWSVTG